MGLGGNLNKRFLSDRTITVDDLRARIEYTVSLTPSGLRLLNADHSAARRSIGAHSIACFQANHVLSRQWAEALFSAGAHGILHSSARSRCLLCAIRIYRSARGSWSVGRFRLRCNIRPGGRVRGSGDLVQVRCWVRAMGRAFQVP
jgi:hypothetical protein